MISPNIPLCDLASLNWVSHRVPSSPAEVGWKRGGGREPFVQGWTHTHTRTFSYTNGQADQGADLGKFAELTVPEYIDSCKLEPDRTT